jgi:hypothetical protein
VPAYRLSLAIFVRRQEQLACVFQQPLELFYLGRLAVRNNVERVEILVDVHTQPGPALAAVFCGNLLGALGQIADVADAGLDRITAAKVFANGPRLGR